MSDLHPKRPITFAGEQPQSGYEWLDALMNGSAAVTAEMLFITFAVGQAGALFRTEPEEAEEFLQRLEIDVADFKDAATQYVLTVEAIVANGRRNLTQRKGT